VKSFRVSSPNKDNKRAEANICLGEFAVFDIKDIKFSATPFNILNIPIKKKMVIMFFTRVGLLKQRVPILIILLLGKGKKLLFFYSAASLALLKIELLLLIMLNQWSTWCGKNANY
jgi:hypothetical protein